MGVVRTEERRRQEFLEGLLSVEESFYRGKFQEKSKNNNHLRLLLGGSTKRQGYYDYEAQEEEEDMEEKIVCVTSAASFLGVFILKQLLAHGYSVRALIDKQEDKDFLVREMKTSSSEFNVTPSIGGWTDIDGKVVLEIIQASAMDVESLYQCFEGCRGVFHTSSFIDPAGSSGYSKTMAEIEKKGSENVMEACIRTTSVRKCVFTSSLLACIWQEHQHDTAATTTTINITDDSWSDESICTNRKLWYALGKLKAEKAAWRIAKENNAIKLATICPGLVTGPNYALRTPTPTLAYLKGLKDMYAQGLFATVDIARLAHAHICVYESMNKSGGWMGGRYICFDRMIRTQEEAEKISQETGVKVNIDEVVAQNNGDARLCVLSNEKLYRLMSTTAKRCNHDYYYHY